MEYREVREITWETASGQKIKIKDLGDQHLSNIYWFQRVFHGWVIHPISLELRMRLKGKGPLDWKPLPVSGEIELLKKMNKIRNGNIYHEGKCIGSNKHIK